MDSPTDSGTWSLDGDDTEHLLAALVGAGLLCFCYGLAVEAGLLRTGWGVFAVLPYVVMQAGGLLAALGVLAFRLRRGEGPPSFREAAAVSVVATAAAVVATVLAHRVGGSVSAYPQFLGWTVLGLSALGLQFTLGVADTPRERWEILGTEALAAFVVVVGFLTLDRAFLNLASFAFVGAGAALLFLAAGGPLFLLGERLRAEN